MTINGPGSNLLTVKGNDTFRIFTLFFGTTVTPTSEVSISGMTISNGFDNFFGGGAIFVQFGRVSITNVTVTANSGITGGGIQLFNGASLTAENSTISNNTVTDSGAAINGIQSSTIDLTNTTVSGNTAANSGGGIQASDGATVTINGSTFSNNTATAGNGGGLDISTFLEVTNTSFTGNTANNGGGGINNSGTAIITNCNISNNSAAGGGFAQGGGINNAASLTIIGSTINGNASNRLGAGIFSGANGATTTDITDSTISNNSLSTTLDFDGGGGLYLGPNDTATITSSTVSGNTVATTSNTGSGGGILAGGTLTLTHSTVVNNMAAFAGGGLNRPMSGNTVSLRNSIIANNIDDGTAPDLDGTFNSNGFNLIESTTGATINGDTTTNITGQEPMLGPLQANGGPTFTHALLVGSPAIDKGNSSMATTDQRMETRPVDKPSIPNAAGGDGADIGAFEDQPIVMFSTDIFNADEPDLVATITVLRSGGTEGIDTVDYATSMLANLEFSPATGGASCTEGVDFINTSGTVTFNEGVSSQTFDVTICNDTLVENMETFKVELSNPSGKSLGHQRTAFVNIISEDVYIPQRPLFDFDGDGRSDISVFRPDPNDEDNNYWKVFQSSNNQIVEFEWGVADDASTLAPAD